MAAAIHGDKAQNMRQRVLRKFKAGELRILVATDIASRGIDIDDLGYVINYEIPNVPETYVHRIGRSGRAGKNGHAISICEPEENIYIKNIEKLIGKKIPVVENNPFPQTDKPMTAEERKEWEKEKQERKRAFFESRKNQEKGNKSKNQQKKTRKKKDRSGSRDTNNTKSHESQNDRRKKDHGSKPKKKAGPNDTRYSAMPDSIKKKLMWPLD